MDFDDIISDLLNDKLEVVSSTKVEDTNDDVIDLPQPITVKYQPKEEEIIEKPPVQTEIKKSFNKLNSLISINQSLINKLFKKGEWINHCNYYIKRVFIDKDIKTVTTDAMKAGLFGEQIILGSSAGDDITFLDRNRKSCKNKEYYEENGSCQDCKIYNNCKKTSSEEKIIIQTEVFKKLADEMFINIAPLINTQISIYKRFKGEQDFIIKGTMDAFPFFALIDDEMKLCLMDLKFTQNIDSEFGYMNWSDPEQIDYLQLDYYNYLLKDFDFELNDHLTPEQKLLFQFAVPYVESNNLHRFFWVFDYKPKIENINNIMRPVPYPYSKIVHNEIHETIRTAIDYIKNNNAMGLWNERKVCGTCKQCPFNTECEEYYNNNNGNWNTGYKYNKNANFEATLEDDEL